MYETISEQYQPMASQDTCGGTMDSEFMATSRMQELKQEQDALFAPSEPQPNQTGVPDELKMGMENVSGLNLDHVKVHYNSENPAEFQSYAYAQGYDIHLASGQEKHLPHELGHVVQQMRGQVQANSSVGGMALNDNAGLESEATWMGNMALQLFSKKDVGGKDKSITLEPIIQRKWVKEMEQNQVVNESYPYFRTHLWDSNLTRNHNRNVRKDLTSKLLSFHDLKELKVMNDSNIESEGVLIGSNNNNEYNEQEQIAVNEAMWSRIQGGATTLLELLSNIYIPLSVIFGNTMNFMDVMMGRIMGGTYIIKAFMSLWQLLAGYGRNTCEVSKIILGSVFMGLVQAASIIIPTELSRDTNLKNPTCEAETTGMKALIPSVAVCLVNIAIYIYLNWNATKQFMKNIKINVIDGAPYGWDKIKTGVGTACSYGRNGINNVLNYFMSDN